MINSATKGILRFVPAMILFSAISGCGKNEGVSPENQMPRTYLSLIKPGAVLDTTDYRKILHWWGTDTDGRVTGYLFRWNGGWEPPPGTRVDYRGLPYSLTTATQDTFDVPVGGAFAVRAFTIRAVDDRDLIDSTGVTQSFAVLNHIPHIEWNDQIPLPDTSLAAVGFGWKATDFDGRATVRTFKIWLDGGKANPRTVTDTVAALRPEDFGDRVNQERTVFVQGFDDAMTPTDGLLAHTWYVEAPKGPFLYLRMVSRSGQIDRWDRKVFDALLASVSGGSHHVIDLRDGPDFATAAEIEPLFSLFEGVAWLAGPYDQDNDAKMARNLRWAEPAIRTYVERGGRVLLIGNTILGYEGGLSSAFARDVLGIPRFFQKLPNEPGEVTTTNIPLGRDEQVLFGSPESPDSIKVYSASTWVDYFLAPAGPGSARYWVRQGTLRRMIGEGTEPPQDDQPAFLGIVSHFGTGRVTAITSPYARLFPNPGSGEPQGLEEGVRLFQEALLP